MIKYGYLYSIQSGWFASFYKKQSKLTILCDVI